MAHLLGFAARLAVGSVVTLLVIGLARRLPVVGRRAAHFAGVLTPEQSKALADEIASPSPSYSPGMLSYQP